MKTFISFGDLATVEWKPMPLRREMIFVAAVPEGYRARLLSDGRCVALPKDGMSPPLVLERGEWREIRIGG